MKTRKPKKQTTLNRQMRRRVRPVMDKGKEPLCIDFTIWVDGRRINAGAHVGTMVTIGSGRQVIGLRPTLSSDDPKRVTVTLLKLKSHNQAASDYEELKRVKVAFGRSASFEPTKKIKFVARPFSVEQLPVPAQRFIARHAPPQEEGAACCLRTESGESICATCYLDFGEDEQCCATFACCVLLLLKQLAKLLPD